MSDCLSCGLLVLKAQVGEGHLVLPVGIDVRRLVEVEPRETIFVREERIVARLVPETDTACIDATLLGCSARLIQ